MPVLPVRDVPEVSDTLPELPESADPLVMNNEPDAPLTVESAVRTVTVPEDVPDEVPAGLITTKKPPDCVPRPPATMRDPPVDVACDAEPASTDTEPPDLPAAEAVAPLKITGTLELNVVPPRIETAPATVPAPDVIKI